MRCPRCNEDDIHGPVCSCGLSAVHLTDDPDDFDRDEYIGVPHSRMSRREAIREARALGDPSEGDGWRRLVWRLADLLDGKECP